jgi:hypothetical protein
VNDSPRIVENRVKELESSFTSQSNSYNKAKRTELRTLYMLLGNYTKALEQANIILANDINDKETLVFLSQENAYNSGRNAVERLLNLSLRYSNYRYLSAAVRIRAGDLFFEQGKKSLARDSYKLAFNGPLKYAQLARNKYNLAR